ncbi:MAG: hypothetical protein JRJ27_06690, partial [Deltaproteobacteria bacterium]|nr:hypothetical protein [Deltaproteobacteria bacterium]
MAKKKKGRPKKKKSSVPKSLKPQLLRILVGISILIILVVSAGLIANYFIFQKPAVPSFEVYPKDNIPSRVPITKPIPSGRLP